MDNNKIVASQPSKGLITDIFEDILPGEYWTYARNAVLNSHLGQSAQIQVEPATLHCVDLPYKPIGFIRLLNNRWAVFTTDNTDSEIGVFDESKCTYTKLVNAKCLNFHVNSPIEGASKELSDCSEIIYWTDARNPRRTLDINNIPYLYSTEDDDCKSKVFTNQLDCDALLVDKKVSVPVIKVRRSTGGELRNGVYEFAIAYTDNDLRITDYMSVTPPQAIWTHENFGQAIDLEITGLDRDFDEYELICIYTINGIDNYKSLGYHSTAVDRQHVDSINRPEYTAVDIKEIIVKRPRYDTADGIEANDQYLLWYGLKTTPEVNYQPQAMNIISKYVVYEVPVDYYTKGGNKVGYMRDEVYAFAIQWLRDTGDWTSAYHIPGTTQTRIDSNASGRDVYELTLRDQGLETDVEVPIWEVENTATPMSILNIQSAPDEKIIGDGYMGYWQSTNLYPDNADMFGDVKCTPIRHHKFPDNCTTHIYANEGKNLRILGIKFENIEHPLGADGNPLKGIKGYRIVRSDRRGNKSIVAKGVFTNVRSYNETGKTILYANYPFNDLRQDNFLSAKQTYFNGSERDFRPLDGVLQDQFNFYSPDTLFNHTSLGQEVKLYTEEHSNIRGYFEEVYKHPKAKLFTQFDLYFAMVIGALDGYYAMRGKTCVTKVGKQEISLGLGANVVNTPSGPSLPTPSVPGSVAPNTQVSACDDALAFTSALSADPTKIKGVERVLRTLAKAGIFAFFAMKTANAVLDIIANASPWQQYALQYNSHGLFNNYSCIPRGNKRRFLEYYQYIFDGLNTVQGNVFNNYKRENSVYLKFQTGVDAPRTEDNSRNTLTDLKLCNNINAEVTKNASLFYGAVKRPVPGQYGQLDSVRYLDTGFLVTDLSVPSDTTPVYTSDIIFGGDTFVNKFSVKRSQHYFTTYLQDVPDGYIADYKNYRNLAYPRYWIDTRPYDLSGLITERPSMSRTPRQKHHLSCQGENSTNGIAVVKDRYFYLFNSGVMEFFVESEINVAYRDYKNNECTYYAPYNSDISQLFRADRILAREEYTYDRSFSKQLIENAVNQQRLDFEPTLAKTCYEYHKNRIIYSLPHIKGSKRDNWMVYLANNMYEFPVSDYGNLTAIHGVDNQQMMFLFDKSAPYISIGRDELKLDGSGTKITIGDGGLFAREPRPIAYTDMHYGSCQSKWAFVNTQFGSFYPSQRQGRLFNYKGQLDEISRNGMHWWTKQYMPSRLLEDFPDYPYKDNPVKGLSMLSVFDSTDERYYVTKRDWALKPEYKDTVVYDAVKDKFVVNGMKVDLGDSELFDDASWTLSFNPKDGTFISYHDWHPDWLLQGERHFMSTKGNGIWKHNQRHDLFSNFYGVDYPFQVELPINNQGEVDVLRSIEYHLQVGKYFNSGRDFHHILDDNFDYVSVYNSEQMSGKMKMVLQSKKDLTQLFGYPKMDPTNELVHILYNKEEHKYRINQFADIIKDRGEFTNRTYPLFVTQPNGYIKDINQRALDYTKPVQHRKKFRHKSSKVLFTKNKPGDKNYIFNFAISKQIRSDR